MKFPISPHIHIITFRELHQADEYIRTFLRTHPQTDGFVNFIDSRKTEIIHIGSGHVEVMRQNAGVDNIKIGEMNLDQAVFNNSEIFFKEQLRENVSDFILHPLGYLEVLGFGFANLIPHLLSGKNNLQRLTFTCSHLVVDDFKKRFSITPDYVTKLQ